MQDSGPLTIELQKPVFLRQKEANAQHRWVGTRNALKFLAGRPPSDLDSSLQTAQLLGFLDVLTDRTMVGSLSVLTKVQICMLRLQRDTKVNGLFSYSPGYFLEDHQRDSLSTWRKLIKHLSQAIFHVWKTHPCNWRTYCVNRRWN